MLQKAADNPTPSTHSRRYCLITPCRDEAKYARRTLDSVARQSVPLQPYHGPTDLFITSGFDFRVTDAIITNFHLPKSTLLAMISAFAGRDLVLHAYQVAIDEGYRFYSFGDAMLIL